MKTFTSIILAVVIATTEARVSRDSLPLADREQKSRRHSLDRVLRHKGKGSSSKRDFEVCTCDAKEYIWSDVPIDFATAQVQAAAMGCQLATFDTPEEQAAIQTTITSAPPIGGGRNFWVGLIRPYLCPSGNCDTGSPAEGWMWLDGCTNYEDGFWAAGQPSNSSPSGLQQNQGWINQDAELSDESPNVVFRALFECCAEPGTPTSSPPTPAPTKGKGKGKTDSPTMSSAPSGPTPAPTKGKGKGKGTTDTPTMSSAPSGPTPAPTKGKGKGKGKTDTPTMSSAPSGPTPAPTKGKGKGKGTTDTPTMSSAPSGPTPAPSKGKGMP